MVQIGQIIWILGDGYLRMEFLYLALGIHRGLYLENIQSLFPLRLCSESRACRYMVERRTGIIPRSGGHMMYTRFQPL